MVPLTIVHHGDPGSLSPWNTNMIYFYRFPLHELGNGVIQSALLLIGLFPEVNIGVNKLSRYGRGRDAPVRTATGQR